MKKFLQFTIVLGILMLLVVACIPSISSIIVPISSHRGSTPPQPEDLAKSQEAQVQSVEIQMSGNDPVQVTAIVRGELKDACAQLGDALLRSESNTFIITLLIKSSSDQGCAQVSAHFEQNIPLNVAGLPSGEYLVKANGVSTVFTLPFASAPTGEQFSSGGQEQFNTFTSALYGYKVNYPADWKILINTSVPSKPGSNPEYVTLTSNDASNLPRIEIQVLTGEPPMVGYENCHISNDFVFRGLPACKISLPAGQNPATELLIFQKDTAYFFIAMQYQSSQPIQLFDDFLSSFTFIP